MFEGCDDPASMLLGDLRVALGTLARSSIAAASG
jgi:hypothetical protein